MGNWHISGSRGEDLGVQDIQVTAPTPHALNAPHSPDSLADLVRWTRKLTCHI